MNFISLRILHTKEIQSFFGSNRKPKNYLWIWSFFFQNVPWAVLSFFSFFYNFSSCHMESLHALKKFAYSPWQLICWSKNYCARVHMYTCAHVHACVYTWTHAHVCTCPRVHVHVCKTNVMLRTRFWLVRNDIMLRLRFWLVRNDGVIRHVIS